MLFQSKRDFQIILEENCENTTAKKSETRTKVDSLFERVGSFCQKASS